MEFSAQQIADFLKGTIVGDPSVKVNNFSKIEEGAPGTLTFLANPKYESFIYSTQADIVLVNDDFKPQEPIQATLIRVPNAYSALAILLNLVEQSKAKKTGVDSTASIASTAKVGEQSYVGSFAYIGNQTVIGNNCLIYPHAYIGDRVVIGDHTIVYPHVTIYDDTRVGSHCILHAGAVIGSDGFGFAPDAQGVYQKIPQLGNVVLEDAVEVGANTTIDRAVMGSTVIHRGVKLDNLIQIAHNVDVGENTVMAAQAGLAGSTKVGRGCRIGGQVGIAGHLKIGDQVQIAAQSGIMRNINEPQNLLGSPAIPVKDFLRSNSLFNRLPELYRILNQLTKDVEELKKNNNQ